MDVYFLRHGVAVEPDEWTGRDFDRPLTDKGVTRMDREACGIAAILLDLDIIVTSPLVRARQTAEIVAERMELRREPIKDERLGGSFSIEQLPAILADHSDAQSIMLVGHEPSFSQVVGHLIGRADVEIKKGALAGVTLAGPSSSNGILTSLIPPKVLIKLGKG